MADYHVHVDYTDDEEVQSVRVTEEWKDGENRKKPKKVLLSFEFEHPINSRLVKDARREAMKRMAKR